MNSAPLRRRSTRVRRTASKTMLAAWKRKPMRTNLISPNEAMMTPTTMKETFPKARRFGEETPRAQLASMTATGMVAWWGCVSLDCLPGPGPGKIDLEHLDKGHAEVEICQVAAD